MRRMLILGVLLLNIFVIGILAFSLAWDYHSACLGAEDHLHPWRKELVFYAALAACFALFSGLFTWLILRVLRQREDGLQALKESEERNSNLGAAQRSRRQRP